MLMGKQTTELGLGKTSVGVESRIGGNKVVLLEVKSSHGLDDIVVTILPNICNYLT